MLLASIIHLSEACAEHKKPADLGQLCNPTSATTTSAIASLSTIGNMWKDGASHDPLPVKLALHAALQKQKDTGTVDMTSIYMPLKYNRDFVVQETSEPEQHMHEPKDPSKS